MLTCSHSQMQKTFSGPRGWFALSGYSFKIEPTGSREGYTVVRLADAEDDEKDGGGKYVLWELER